jgi:prevent-host-death family protein
MNLKDIKPISYIKSHAAEILSQINQTHRPVFITQNGEAKAVLVDAESYEQMQKTLGMLKLLASGEKDIADKKYKEQNEFFDFIDEYY